VELEAAGLGYRGWLANHQVPGEFANHHFTLHVPRRPYAERLPGIPTIRVFEALACGIPLISAPWRDSEALFAPGCYLTARDGGEVRARMRDVLHDKALAADLRARGLAAIRARHTCDHRAAELLSICARICEQQSAKDVA
jgi:spore maturation protein CgeB